MKITTSDIKTVAKTPLLVVPVLEGQAVKLPSGVKAPAGFDAGFEAKERATRSTFCVSGPATRVLLIGLGSPEKLDEEMLRRAGALAVKFAEGNQLAKLTIWAGASWKGTSVESSWIGRSLAEGAYLGAYRYTVGKSKPEAATCKQTVIATGDAGIKRGVKVGLACAQASALARDLQNGAGNTITPRALASAARKVAAGSPKISIKVLDEPAMAKLGMNLLLGVSAGSVEPARMIHLTYKPKGKSRGRIALVGKGLTFDAGGLSIKPSSKMDEMRYDMSGGAAVIGVFEGLAKLDVPFEVHGIVGASENVIGPAATKPGDIHAAMNGTTVEILNTDAEGRLLLADCLCYVAQKVKPDTILDLATLTGAIIVALGHELTGLFGNSKELQESLYEAGEAVGEGCWPMPLLEAHKAAMKGTSADLTNLGSPAVGAGSSTAAAFLSNFVPEGTAWCHLDIAGSAWNTRNRDWVGGPQGSGVGTRLLLEYLLRR
ncbi:MAG: leucyl aminopeptidase [Planctomycetota bacterium]|jgi:leucyl aminopeptidase